MPLSSKMHTFIASDGLEIRYAVDDFSDPWRPRETLFLLHAAMGSSRRLYKWVPLLARHFKVVRPDMRGHGLTAMNGSDELSLTRLTKDVIELADHLGCPQFHLAGSSAGAIVSMQTTLDYPAHIKTLANFASTPGLKNSLIQPEQWIAKIKAKGLRGFLEETIYDRFPKDTDPGFLKWFIDEACRTSEELLYRFVPMMKEVDQTDRLPEIKCPMISVIPGHDPLGTPEQYAIIKKQVPHSEYVILDGYAHNITDAAPVRCAEELVRFLLQHRQT